jgi:hypothetical protein
MEASTAGDPKVMPETTVAKTTPGTPPSDEFLAKRRLERIQQYLVESLEQEDAWRGCVGPVVSDLLEMCMNLKVGIDKEMKQAGSFVGVLANLEPALNSYLRIVRQFERLLKLDGRIRGIDVGQNSTAKPLDGLPEA